MSKNDKRLEELLREVRFGAELGTPNRECDDWCDDLRRHITEHYIQKDLIRRKLMRIAPVNRDHGDCEHCKRGWAEAVIEN